MTSCYRARSCFGDIKNVRRHIHKMISWEYQLLFFLSFFFIIIFALTGVSWGKHPPSRKRQGCHGSFSMSPGIKLVHLASLSLLIDIHSLAILFGATVKLLVNANILSANHMATTQCILACRNVQNNLLKFKLSIQIVNRDDSNHFEYGIVVGGLSVSELLIHWDFPTKPSVRFTEMVHNWENVQWAQYCG